MSEDEKKGITQPILLTPEVESQLTKAREHLDVGPSAGYPVIIQELLATHPTDFGNWPSDNESE